MTYGDASNTFVAAASYGEGRIVAFSHKNLLNSFNRDYYKNKKFNDNIVKWVTKSQHIKREDVNVINIHKMTNFEDVRKHFNHKPTIIGWESTTARSNEFMKSLSMWIKKGGSFVCGLTPWSWKKKQKGRQYQQIPIFSLLKVSLCSFQQMRFQRVEEPLRQHHVFYISIISPAQLTVFARTCAIPNVTIHMLFRTWN